MDYYQKNAESNIRKSALLVIAPKNSKKIKQFENFRRFNLERSFDYYQKNAESNIRKSALLVIAPKNSKKIKQFENFRRFNLERSFDYYQKNAESNIRKSALLVIAPKNSKKIEQFENLRRLNLERSLDYYQKNAESNIRKSDRAMEAVIFIGIQASGKSTFYREHFLNTHIRINLDMLKTRHREKIIFQACLEAKQSFVIDNTNPTVADRQRYIPPAKEKYFDIIAYYFSPDLESCKQRNEKRSKKQKIPIVGIISTYNKLEKPSYKEGFDRIYTVKIAAKDSFIIEEYKNEI